MISIVHPLVSAVIGSNDYDFTRVSYRLEREAECVFADAPSVDTLAALMSGRIPIFYGSEHMTAVAYRAKCQINENAKAAAFFSEVPEANHNEIESYHALSEADFLPIILRSRFETEKTRARLQATQTIMTEQGLAPLCLRVHTEDSLEEALAMTLLLDRVSLRLAELRGVDPLNVHSIRRLKSILSQS